METQRRSLVDSGVLWFGAGVSIAEILTGTYFAGIGWKKGILAIVIGHIFGCVLLFLAGVLGGLKRKSAMETSKQSFGQKGSYLFALMNILQLIGWTAIMILDGAMTANSIGGIGTWLWSLAIGILILLWLYVNPLHLNHLNRVAMLALFILTLILSVVLLGKNALHTETVGETMSFGAALELSIAMPLSWLPLISDYTREAKEPVKASAVSALVYGLVSIWMYGIGMFATLYTGEFELAPIILKTGLGILGLIIIIFSTVTTTYLDAYSAGVSSETLQSLLSTRTIAIATTILGVLSAIFYPLTNLIDFLYLIGTVFAPMIAIQIADIFILKRNVEEKNIDFRNLGIWLLGFLVYRLALHWDSPVGSTLPVMVFVVLLCIVVDFFEKAFFLRNK